VVTVAVLTGESPSLCPVTGSSHFRKEEWRENSPPAKTEPTPG